MEIKKCTDCGVNPAVWILRAGLKNLCEECKRKLEWVRRV